MLASKYQKRLFFGSAFLAFASLVITRFFLIPYLSGKPVEGILIIINAVLDNFLAALITSISVTLLLLWLTPPSAELAVMEVIDSPRIAEVLKQGRDRVTEYWYKGNTGRYVRSVVLPNLAKEARLENATKNVFLIVLDPLNDNACEYYALFRKRLRSAVKDKPWTGLRVQLELYSTIVSTYAWKAQEPSLNVTVALVDVMSLFRIDFSSRLAVITREDERQPALMCEANTLFYKSYREDLFISLQQARVLPNNVIGVPLQHLDLNNTKKLIITNQRKNFGILSLKK